LHGKYSHMPMVVIALLPFQRQGSKRACNLSDSSCPRDLGYKIGKDR
jgi:hypothetical protein